MDIAALTIQEVTPLIGQNITIHAGEQDLTLRLDAVKPLSETNSRDAANRVAFCMTLSGPLDPMLAQGAWDMTLPDLGRAALFLSPFSQTAEATLYEIILN